MTFSYVKKKRGGSLETEVVSSDPDIIDIESDVPEETRSDQPKTTTVEDTVPPKETGRIYPRER